MRLHPSTRTAVHRIAHGTVSSAALVAAVGAFAAGEPPLRLDQIQVLGSHNSYKQAISPKLLASYRFLSPDGAEALDYQHPSLTVQLDLGLRQLELDIFHDPEGGRYAHPAGLDWAPEPGVMSAAMLDLAEELEAPGFKVLHVQDLDFRSSCATLVACLLELQTWSDEHPGHLPVLVTMNAKDEVIDRPGFTAPLPFDAAAFDALDADLVRALGRDKLLTPDDVRGELPTLEAAVLAHGWPTLDEARGRFLFVLDEGGAKRDAYLAGHPSLRGRVLFVDVEPGHPAAAIRIVNDPIERGDEIRGLVRRGYLVRTRADADTREARTGATTRRDAAFASGAQFVSSDYYAEEQRLASGYLVRLPGSESSPAPVAARCNPITSVGQDDACLLPATPSRPAELGLIAHRGGVVDEATPENSRASIRQAVERGYRAIEIDLRETRDGELVLQHDPSFYRYYSDRRLASDMTRAEIETLRGVPGGDRPLFLDELCGLARGRLELMIDLKSRDPAVETLERLASKLGECGLLRGAWVIGTDATRQFFLGRARVGAALEQIEAAAARSEDVSRTRFLFAHGRDLTALEVLRARELGVTVVPSINRFHYAGLEAPDAAAQKDLGRLTAIGVRIFQIDSEYQPRPRSARPDP